jgi:hypothetical protein
MIKKKKIQLWGGAEELVWWGGVRGEKEKRDFIIQFFWCYLHFESLVHMY